MSRFVSDWTGRRALRQQGALSPAAECHDRFGGGQEPGGKVTRGAPHGAPPRAYKPSRWTRRRTEDACRDRRLRAVRVRSTGVSLLRSGLRLRARHGLVSPRSPRVSGESVGNPPDPS